MRYPPLVPARLCRTPVQVHLESEEVNDKGKPMLEADLDLFCNYQDKARTILTAEKKLVQVNGCAMFDGDIAPEFPSLSGGYIVVFGRKRRIEQGMKARNPDGTVNYCWLDVV